MDLQSICIGHKSTRQWVFTQEACESADAAPCVRVEYRYDKGNYLLKELHQKLDDPLNPITIRRYSEIPDLDDTQARLLFDVLRLRGKKRVLELYSDDEQESIQAAINRFPMIDESKLRLAIWAQLRGEIEALLPDSGNAVL